MIFVWQGGEVLRNYSSGMVVVAAPTVEAAWERLKTEDKNTWFRLMYDTHCYYGSIEDSLSFMDKDDFDRATANGFPLQPIGYTEDDLPILVKEGGE